MPEHSNFQDTKSMFMIRAFKIFKHVFKTDKFWFIVGLTAILRLFQWRNSTFLVFIVA